MAAVFVVLLLVFGLGVCFYNSFRSIYAWTDHYGWEDNSSPDKNAKIKNITSEKVLYGSSSTYAKLKTKITFSDGFYYITHKTDYNHIGVYTYQVYLSDELREKIIGLAIEKHDMAVEKFVNSDQSAVCNSPTYDSKTQKDMTQIKIEIVNNNEYIKLNFDDRVEYLYNLKKQTTSELNKLKKALEIENNKIKAIPADIAKYIKPNDVSSLKDNITKLENKKLVIVELIALEVKDEQQKKEYEELTKKIATKKVSIGDHTTDKDEKNNDWQYWD